MNVALLTRSLVAGGAERQLLMLAAGLAARGHRCTILTFYVGSADPRPPPGVRVVTLRKRGRWDVLGFMLRLRRAVRESEADLLYAFLPVANLLSLLMGALHPSLKVVLGLRASDMDMRSYDRLSRFADQLEARFCRRADAVIVNSEAGCRHAVARGVPPRLLSLIRNGVDLDRFRPGASSLRAEFGIDEDTPLVGLVARWDPMKDHRGFARALGLLHRRRQRLAAVIVGDVPDAARAECEALAEGASIRWLPWRADIDLVYRALDVLCLSSAWGEGTSNVVAEAMACGVPCVVTDVGDNRLLVGDTGEIVPPGDAEALCEGLAALLTKPSEARAELGRRARERIAELYSPDSMVEQTIEVFHRVAFRRPS
ncbi:MAG TPA: glycosyltransferase [Stellaceae bacterium]|nr:glycosyltransferase [Stellaceae bacterium]